MTIPNLHRANDCSKVPWFHWAYTCYSISSIQRLQRACARTTGCPRTSCNPQCPSIKRIVFRVLKCLFPTYFIWYIPCLLYFLLLYSSTLIQHIQFSPGCSTPQPPCAAYPDPDQACADAKDGNKAVAKALETSLEEKDLRSCKKTMCRT